jgi:hypothetical protein
VLEGADPCVEFGTDLVAELDGEREIARRQEARLGVAGNA